MVLILVSKSIKTGDRDYLFKMNNAKSVLYAKHPEYTAGNTESQFCFEKQKNITESDTFFDFQYHLEKFTILKIHFSKFSHSDRDLHHVLHIYRNFTSFF